MNSRRRNEQLIDDFAKHLASHHLAVHSPTLTDLSLIASYNQEIMQIESQFMETFTKLGENDREQCIAYNEKKLQELSTEIKRLHNLIESQGTKPQFEYGMLLLKLQEGVCQEIQVMIDPNLKLKQQKKEQKEKERKGEEFNSKKQQSPFVSAMFSSKSEPDPLESIRRDISFIIAHKVFFQEQLKNVQPIIDISLPDNYVKLKENRDLLNQINEALEKHDEKKMSDLLKANKLLLNVIRDFEKSSKQIIQWESKSKPLSRPTI